MVLFYFPILLAIRLHRFHTMGEVGKWDSATLPPSTDAAAPYRHPALFPRGLVVGLPWQSVSGYEVFIINMVRPSSRQLTRTMGSFAAMATDGSYQCSLLCSHLVLSLYFSLSHIFCMS